MTVRDLVRGLGGGAAVARRCGVTPQAVSHWSVANDVPAAHRMTLWHAALEAGLAWEPPGADAIRAQFGAAAPKPASAEAA